MKVLVTGATGLIGKEVVALLLQNGISVHYVTTSKKKIQKQPFYQGFYWDPQKGVIDENCFLGVDVIIHLAGATIAKRWTNCYKEEIIESRTLTASLLYNALKNNPNTVKQIISASAIGIYPDNLKTEYSENETQLSATFLGSVTQQWEASADMFSRLSIQVCKIRIGLVLAQHGGVLKQLAKPIRFGFGVVFGNGEQMQSWIHIHDLAAIFLFAIQHQLAGVYNAVAPNPVTHQEMVRQIARGVHQEILLPNIPKFVMKLVLGEMHILLYESQNVSCKKIQDKGFVFKYKQLEKALDDLL